MATNRKHNVITSACVTLAYIALAYIAHAASPVVANVRAEQRDGTKLVEIRYDVSDSDSSSLTISVAVSTNGDTIADLTAATFETNSAAGSGVAPGRDKLIVWNAGADWNGKFSQQVRFQITADDTSAPSGMVLIPAGWFVMGATTNVGHEYYSDEVPQHTVYVSAFYMDKHEVTKAKWDEVYTWAIANGYSFDNAGAGKATDHPVQTVNWYDVVKWCNARSEKEGRTPAYYTSATLIPANIYRTGQVGVQTDWVLWTAGYRLPTEAEWEKAARGGVAGHRFPWSDADTIQHVRQTITAARHTVTTRVRHASFTRRMRVYIPTQVR